MALSLEPSNASENVTGAKRKRWLACEYCREKKVRCDGGNPCSYCEKHNQRCEISTRRRVKDKLLDAEVMAQRLARLESMLARSVHSSPEIAIQSVQPTAILGSQNEPDSALAASSLPLQSNLYDKAPEPGRPYQDAVAVEFPTPRDDNISQTQGILVEQEPLSSFTPPNYADNITSAHRVPIFPSYDDSMLDDAAGNCDEEQEGSSVYSAETYLEYQGPRSFLSICSQPGIQWVTTRVKVPDFQKSATRFTRDMTRRLKLAKKIMTDRAPDPDVETALSYTKAFFESDYEATFGIIQRPWFEGRLRMHLRGDSPPDDDASWYALRNMIFASGCRKAMSRSSTMLECARASWPYFENALSVHTELMFLPSSIVGVQALVLMAYYTEGVGSPLLQYILCADAIRLACSKGLHRQPARSWNLPQHEISHRSWIFWAIYCLDKHISSRSGRPSIMEDEEINCEIPAAAPSYCSMNLAACTVLIKLHQLCSLVGKSLSSAKAFRQNPTELLQTVTCLDEKVRTLGEEVDNVLSMKTPLDPSCLPRNLSLKLALALHFTYYTLLFDIHTTLTYPWSRGIISLRQHPSFRDQVERSYSIVAKASREAILATRHIPLDAACPFLLAYYTPVYALINLFIHILQAPNLPSTDSDLLLMELGVGHFIRLELATESQISTPFVKDIAQMARNVVDHAKTAINADSAQDIPESQQHMATNMTLSTVRYPTARPNDLIYEDGMNEWLDLPYDPDMEMWSSLLPIVGQSPTDLILPTMIG